MKKCSVPTYPARHPCFNLASLVSFSSLQKILYSDILSIRGFVLFWSRGESPLCHLVPIHSTKNQTNQILKPLEPKFQQMNPPPQHQQPKSQHPYQESHQNLFSEKVGHLTEAQVFVEIF